MGALAFTAAPALAAGPEAPEALKPEPIKPTEATLQGIVNPKIVAATEPGTYQFLYKATKTDTKAECESAGASKVPASPGMYLGLEPEHESEPVTGLTEGTEYVVCLAVTNTKSETTVSPPYFPFQTGLKLETPVNAKVKAGSITAATAEVEGELNPGKERKTDQGYVEYLYKLSPLSEPPTGECEESVFEENGLHYQSTSGVKEEKVSGKLTNLQPNAKYTFCLRVGNEDGETLTGAPVHFTTLPAPPEIPSESVSNVTSSEVTFEGTVNPNNQLTECHFQYGISSVTENTIPCSPEQLKGFGSQSVGPKNAEGAPVPTGVSAGAVYHYRIVTKNGKGEEATGPEQRFQTFEAPTTEAPTEVSATAWELHGVLDPNNARSEEPGGYEFVYRQSSSECRYALSASELKTLEAEIEAARSLNDNAKEKEKEAELGKDRAKEAENKHTTPGSASGAQGQPVEVEVSGLLPGAPYTVCLLVRNGAGNPAAIGARETFTTATSAPLITDEQSSEVGPSEATVGATIDPAGLATGYRVQYVTAAHFAQEGFANPSEAPAPPAGEVNVGAATTPFPVSQRLSGLEPTTEYRYRFVAHNTLGTVTDVENKTFTTVPSSTAAAVALPDNRAYEMVSPVANEDANVFEPISFYGNPHESFGSWTRGPFRASADGASVVYVSTPTAAGGGSSAPGLGQENIARREAGGWSVQPIQPAGLEFPKYQGFSSDLSTGVIGSRSEGEALSAGVPKGSYHVLYAHTLSEAAYRPLFTATPPHREPEQFSAGPVWVDGGKSSLPVYAGGSADMSHLLFEANDALTASAFENPFTLGKAENDLYESVDGQLELVNVSSEGKPVPNATFGSQYSTFERSESSPSGFQPDFSNAISTDGSRVFWTALEYIPYPRSGEIADVGSKALYMREDGTRTVQLDASALPGTEREKAEKGGGGRFATATPDGTKVFFTDEKQLTEGSTAVPGKPDLYECELPPAGGSCTLSDLTVNQSEAANVKGVIGSSENGEYVYFVAEGVLAGNENADHEKAEPQACVDSGTEGNEQERVSSQCNLYVLHRGEAPRFIARLSGEDNELSLERYDNDNYQHFGDWQSDVGLRTAQVAPDGSTLAFMSRRSLTPGYPSEGPDQVYVYDFGSGGLSCASCNPAGAPAVAPASLPLSFNDTYALRDVSEDGGRVFFLSPERLVPRASSGQPDVYEWERDGEGSCDTATGCVYLLSGATSPEQSYFLDASANGDDVFLITRAHLLPQDQNELWDVYDARVDAPEPVTPPACTGTGCQGTPGAPPIFATPSSATITGVDDLEPPPPPAVVKPKTKTVKCAKGKHLSHGKCVKTKKKAKRASRDRRTKS